MAVQLPRAKGAFTETGAMPAACDSQAATLVSGKVLITGGRSGEPLPTAALFDPAKGSFSAIPG